MIRIKPKESFYYKARFINCRGISYIVQNNKGYYGCGYSHGGDSSICNGIYLDINKNN